MAAWDGEIDQPLDWSKPIMLSDGTACKCGMQRSTDWWVDWWSEEKQMWISSLFAQSGKHIRYNHEPKVLPQIVNRPEVDLDAPLYWLDNDERAFVCETFYSESDGAITGYSVDDQTGRLFHVTPDGMAHGLPPRFLANVPLDRLKAEAMVAIKKAQRERAARREQEQLDQLAALNPTLFGAF